MMRQQDRSKMYAVVAVVIIITISVAIVFFMPRQFNVYSGSNMQVEWTNGPYTLTVGSNNKIEVSGSATFTIDALYVYFGPAGQQGGTVDKSNIAYQYADFSGYVYVNPQNEGSYTLKITAFDIGSGDTINAVGSVEVPMAAGSDDGGGDNLPPSAPDLNEATGPYQGEFSVDVTLSWSAATDGDGTISHYKLEISEDSAFSSIYQTHDNLVSRTKTFTISEGGIYYARVFAIDDDGASSNPSNSVSFSVTISQPEQTVIPPPEIDITLIIIIAVVIIIITIIAAIILGRRSGGSQYSSQPQYTYGEQYGSGY